MAAPSPSFVLLITLLVVLALGAAAFVLQRRERPWRLSHALRLVMVGALSVGTCTHLENTWRAGYLPLPQQPLVFNLYWTALTLLDPLAAVLLVLRPRLGLILSLAIMISDVSINGYAFRPTGVLRVDWPFWLQVAFAAFLFATSPYCWQNVGPASSQRD